MSGFVNDNYTGSIENGVSGKYIGADDFQNNFHSLRDISPLYLEYTNSELRPVTGLEVIFSKKNILLNNAKVSCSLNIDIPFGIKPISEIFSILDMIKF